MDEMTMNMISIISVVILLVRFFLTFFANIENGFCDICQ